MWGEGNQPTTLCEYRYFPHMPLFSFSVSLLFLVAHRSFSYLCDFSLLRRPTQRFIYLMSLLSCCVSLSFSLSFVTSPWYYGSDWCKTSSTWNRITTCPSLFQRKVDGKAWRPGSLIRPGRGAEAMKLDLELSALNTKFHHTLNAFMGIWFTAVLL